MKKKIGLIISVLLALGAVGLGHLYLERLEAEISGGQKVGVLVAAGDLPIGKELSKDSLAIRDIPEAYVDRRHVRAKDAKKVFGARVASGLRANELLLWGDLSKFSDHTRVLSGLVQQGMRAVALGDRSVTFEGLLRPGDRVDVLFTRADQGDDRGVTTTLLQNLLVLSVGGNIQRRDEDKKDGSVFARRGAVTLSATVEQAQLLTQATQRGRLTLTLRNPDDVTLVEGVPESTADDLLASRGDEVPQRGKARNTGKVIEHVR